MRGKGFELNPYDPCLESKMIGGKKRKILWHVENLKVSHVDHKEVTNLMEWLEGIYWEPIIKREKLHKCLGMTLDFRTPGELCLIMANT